MANTYGHRGQSWTDAEVETMLAMVDAKKHPRDIAKAMGRTPSSIEGKIRTLRELESMGAPRGRGLPRYETVIIVNNDERKHLQALYDANGHGFGWWPPSLMQRFYQLERSPPASRPFWNAA